MNLFIILNLYIIEIIIYFIDYYTYILDYIFCLNIKLDFLDLYLFNKEKILYCINVLNFIKYICYKKIKYIMINVYFYLIRFFLIIIYNNMPNKFLVNYIYYYYTIKKIISKYWKYIIIGYIKPLRFWRLYYRFYHISYLKILFFFLSFVIFILMWKRRNTYLKRFFIWNIFLFYIFSIFFSFLLWPLFFNKFLALLISLFISFFIIYIRLN